MIQPLHIEDLERVQRRYRHVKDKLFRDDTDNIDIIQRRYKQDTEKI